MMVRFFLSTVQFRLFFPDKGSEIHTHPQMTACQASEGRLNSIYLLLITLSAFMKRNGKKTEEETHSIGTKKESERERESD